MKKVLAIILSLALVLSLVACGGGNVQTGNEGGSSNSDNQDETVGNDETNDTNNDDKVDNDSTEDDKDSSDNKQEDDKQEDDKQEDNKQEDNKQDDDKQEEDNKGNETSVLAAERSINTSGAVAKTDTLANTYSKLTKDKKLKVGYLGGSVTGGTGGTGGYSWASATTKWFKDKFPSAEITEKNVAWGGTSSFWGYFRMDEDNTGRDNLIAFNPDLVFVEFSFNDGSSKLDRIGSSYYMEGIVKKLRAANPKVDIIFVFITAKGTLGADTENILGHKDVAEHYGIPVINVGKALASEIEKTGNDWSYYAGDIVHPNNNGYKVYADCVADYLNGALVSSPDKSGIKDHAKPANDLVSNMTTDSEIITTDKMTDIEGFKAINSSNVNCPSMGQKLLFGKSGNKLKVDFEGKGIGFLADGGAGGKVKITIGSESVIVKVAGGDIFEYMGFENLKSGKYTAEIEIVEGSRVAIGAVLIAK